MTAMGERTSAFGVLRAYLQARASLTEEEFDFIGTKFVPGASVRTSVCSVQVR